jgi:hypothetical protein
MRKVKLSMIGVIITILMTSFYCDLHAQKQVIPDSRLYEMMGQAEVDMMLQLAPEKVLIYNHMLNHSFYTSKNLPTNTKVVGSIYDVKHINGSQIFSASENDILSHKFIFINYNFQRDSEKHLAYKIGESGQYLIVYPENLYFEKETKYVRLFGIKY